MPRNPQVLSDKSPVHVSNGLGVWRLQSPFPLSGSGWIHELKHQSTKTGKKVAKDEIRAEGRHAAVEPQERISRMRSTEKMLK